jgi:hypothetical protein
MESRKWKIEIGKSSCHQAICWRLSGIRNLEFGIGALAAALSVRGLFAAYDAAT